jgi:hypothetical protein
LGSRDRAARSVGFLYPRWIDLDPAFGEDLTTLVKDPGHHPRRDHRDRRRDGARHAPTRDPHRAAPRAVRDPRAGGRWVVAAAHEAGNTSALFAILGAGVCFGLRLVGLRYGINAPSPRAVAEGDASRD